MAASRRSTQLTDFPKAYIDKRRGDFLDFKRNGKIRTMPNGCELWKSQRSADRAYRPGSNNYFSMKWSHGDLKCWPKVHHVSYFLETGELPIPNVIDISHLCHNPTCVNFKHLSREPRSVNEARRRCQLARRCTQEHDDPHCIFVSGRTDKKLVGLTA